MRTAAIRTPGASSSWPSCSSRRAWRQFGDSRDRLGGLLDLAGLQAARADVLAAGRPADLDADLLEVRVEAPLRRHHRVAAAVPERGPLSTHVTDLRHGAEG